MKKLTIILLLILSGCVPVPAQSKIDTLQVFKVGMGKSLDQYLKVCYNDSSEVMAQYYLKGKDTLACDVKQAPPAGTINLYRKKIWIHKQFDLNEFFGWIYYEYKKPKK